MRLKHKIWINVAVAFLILLTACKEEPCQTNQNVAVTGVTLNESTITLSIGNFYTLIATVLPDNATYKRVTWESSNTNVAEVDANGKLLAKSEGAADILVTTTDGKKQASCKCTVTIDDTSQLQIYPVPAGTPQDSKPIFTVTANYRPVGVYTENTAWGTKANFAYVNMRDGYEVTFRIKASINVNQVRVLPESLNITPQVSNGEISFTVSQTNMNITLVFDDNYMGNTLHLFTNPIDDNAPSENSSNLIYFGPGYHQLSGRYHVPSGKSVYIAPGAVIHGRMRLYELQNVRIYGSGVFMISTLPEGEWPDFMLDAINCKNVTVEGIILSSQREGNWNLSFGGSNNISIRNLKIVSARYASTDGVNLISCCTAAITDCFIRAGDDCITFKGANTQFPIEDILVQNCVLWSEANNAMVLGEGTEALYYKNITFKDIDVLFSYDDRDHHGQLNERGVMSIVCAHGTFFEDIIWENVRVMRGERLICMTFEDDIWFGTWLGNQTTPGGIKNVVFKNIISKSPEKTAQNNEISLSGYVENGANLEKKIENILFDNVLVNGNKVTADYSKLKVLGPVSGLEFR